MTYTQTRTGRRSPAQKRSRPYSSALSRPRGGDRNRVSGNRTPRRGGGGRPRSSFDVSQFINRNPVAVAPEPAYESTHTFADFNLSDALSANITRAGLVTPTPIQDEIIPHITEGRDVVGLANTGTGKTAAFLIPLIERIGKQPSRQVLILTPTRELAIQIEAEFRKLSQGMHLNATVCVGGANLRPQMMALKRKNHFIIGTPGRVLDLMGRNAIRSQGITTVVLDEADRMLDMGFIHDMRRILKDIPAGRETLLFSATMPTSIETLVHEFLRNPVNVSVRKKDITTAIEQDVVHYGGKEKYQVLTELLKDRGEFSRVILFGAMKHSVEKLGQQLNRSGIPAESIHGNKSHNQRQRALKRFKDGAVQVLVATDVAARGIHVDNVSHVINYDLPSTYEDYVHRIGRTGRGAMRGKALSFVE